MASIQFQELIIDSTFHDWGSEHTLMYREKKGDDNHREVGSDSILVLGKNYRFGLSGDRIEPDY